MVGKYSSLSGFVLSPIRLEGPGGIYQRHQAAGGGLPRARGLLVPVCGMESPGDLQEQEGLRAHSL